jgi:FtsZ-interacting cell division protein ZipA
MSELRWTLLILGVVFIAALSWWEKRRPRQAFAPRLREGSARADRRERSATSALDGPEGMDPRMGELTGERLPAGQAQEPWIGDTNLSDAVLSDVALTNAAESGDDIMRARVEQPRTGPLDELPTLIIPDAEECSALEAAWDEKVTEPTLVDPEADTAAIDALEPVRATEPVEGERIETTHPAPTAEPLPNRPAIDAGSPSPVCDVEAEIAGAEGVGKARVVEPELPGDGAKAAEPIVEWPPEDSRRILALRLVAPAPDRFPGRSLRLALAAEGFLLGKFSIFHKPDDANRAVLSAASLTRPGSFDLETMDSQRYGGLSLFAVLPGPQAPPQAFEELLAAARNLNERLEGALQDERGGPLTPLRVASIRESLRAEAVTVAAASGQ